MNIRFFLPYFIACTILTLPAYSYSKTEDAPVPSKKISMEVQDRQLTTKKINKISPSNNFEEALATSESSLAFRLDDTTNEIVRLQTTMITPPEPEKKGTVFLWPGLQPSQNGANFQPIGNGVLQPVLTWGPSCAPANNPPAYSTWWISGQYVNTANDANSADHKGCLSGDSISAAPGDLLFIDMELDKGTNIWKQTIKNQSTNEVATYSINMLGQNQSYVYFFIELYDNASFKTPIIFLDTKITWREKNNTVCTYTGNSKAISSPRLDATGKNCNIDLIALTQD